MGFSAVRCRIIGGPRAGQFITVPAGQVRVTVRVYGLVTFLDRILLVTTPDGKLFTPGGGLEPGETLVGCLLREIDEETGVSVEPSEPPMFVEEAFVSHDATGEAWHVVAVFYECKAFSDDLSRWDESEADPGERPVWAHLDTIDPGSLASVVAKVVLAYQDYLRAVGMIASSSAPDEKKG